VACDGYSNNTTTSKVVFVHPIPHAFGAAVDDNSDETTGPLKTVLLQPAHIAQLPANSIHRSLSGLDLTTQEMRYFQDFVEDRFAISQRTCFMSTSAVCCILRECQSNLCVRYASVAVGALSRSIRDRWINDIYSPKSPDSHLEFALRLYHKSLRNLRMSMLPNKVASQRETSMSCLALASFDILYGHKSFAAQHSLCHVSRNPIDVQTLKSKLSS
jgi:hypothetical protein